VTANGLPVGTGGVSAREVAHACRDAARRIITDAAALPREVQVKGESAGGRLDIVTATDPAVERAVSAILTDAFPDHGILGEETGGHTAEAEWLWIIDPIDGTKNFNAGVPLVAFNLALWQAGVPRLALTLDVFQDETFYAEASGGTTLNGRPVRVSGAGALNEAILCFDLGLEDGPAQATLAVLRETFPILQGLRLLGTTALGLAWVAAGRWDGYLHPRPSVWDFAPGVLLVQEAGGIVTDFQGGPVTLSSRAVVAAPQGVHGELVQRLSLTSTGA
jgi:myo-inositol-1(or 4)-monophosphatase